MPSRNLVVTNSSGIHARPAALIVETVTKFRCDVFFFKDGMKANAKSIMNIMLLAAEPGAELKVEANGEDADEVLAALVDLFENGFNND